MAQFKLDTGGNPGKGTVTCPQCGCLVHTSRAALGAGTQRGKGMKVNNNRNYILQVMVKIGKPCSVRDVLAGLNGQKRESPRGTGWNYHTVQADMSLLLGGGHIEMLKPHEVEVVCEEEGHTTPGVPFYRYTGKYMPQRENPTDVGVSNRCL